MTSKSMYLGSLVGLATYGSPIRTYQLRPTNPLSCRRECYPIGIAHRRMLDADIELPDIVKRRGWTFRHQAMVMSGSIGDVRSTATGGE